MQALCAPVCEDVVYRHAKPVDDYIEAFTNQVPTGSNDNVVFSCNFILSFMYSELKGKRAGDLVGPFTVGEVAYQLLNQTLVCLTIDDV